MCSFLQYILIAYRPKVHFRGSEPFPDLELQKFSLNIRGPQGSKRAKIYETPC